MTLTLDDLKGKVIERVIPDRSGYGQHVDFVVDGRRLRISAGRDHAHNDSWSTVFITEVFPPKFGWYQKKGRVAHAVQLTDWTGARYTYDTYFACGNGRLGLESEFPRVFPAQSEVKLCKSCLNRVETIQNA